jgi:hypothetical protein
MEEHKSDFTVSSLHGLTEDPSTLRMVGKLNQV